MSSKNADNIHGQHNKTKKNQSVKNKKGYKDSSFGIARALTEYPKDSWSKEDIEKATARAVNRIVGFIFS